MVTWALDLGTKCGYAVRTETGSLVSSTWNLSPRRGDSYGIRFLRFEQKLNEMLDLTGPPTIIAYEDVRAHKGVQAAHIYGGLQAILTKWCEAKGFQYVSKGVGEIKKEATGKGNARKELMVAAAKEQWPDQDVKDDNQADALWLLHLIEEGGV